MKLFILGICLVALSLSGMAQQTINASITHDGGQRDYILYIPANYTGSEAVPLIFNFHGYTSNATQQMWYGDFRSIADTAGFIIVHPEGTRFNGSTHWNVGGWTLGSTADDVGFTEALLDSLASGYNIDLTRVYSTGMSNGGYMSFLLACQLSNKIAAVSSVTGSMTPETYNACNPQHPTPVLYIHGTNDGTVPYNGAAWTKSVDATLQYWVNYNQCNPFPTITAIPNSSTTDGSTVEHIVYNDGDNNVTTEHFKVTGGDHTWPGSAIPSPGTNYDINASAEIWKFFSRYDVNGQIGTTAVDDVLKGAPKVSIYPNPAQSRIYLEFEVVQHLDYQMITVTGQVVLSGSLHSDQHEIDLSDFPNGMYILKIANKSFKILKKE